MKEQVSSICVREEKIDQVVDRVREALRRERDVDATESQVKRAVYDVLERRVDAMVENLEECLTSPRMPAFRELEHAIAALPSRSHVANSAVAAQELAPVFSGNREFSPAKYTAMMRYIAGRGLHIYKTNLNKLLFYADLSYFFLQGRGISGAIYYNRPFGPVADEAKPLLDELIASGEVSVAERTKHLEASGSGEAIELPEDERKVLDWVLATYGTMGAREISDVSHEEKAYKDTRPNEPIAYAYSKFLKNLPPRSLLGHGSEQ